MKSLFKRIYSLALHPNGFKRLGAALAFNSIYRLFRYNTLLTVLTLFISVDHKISETFTESYLVHDIQVGESANADRDEVLLSLYSN